jgi:hypothetical protein
VPFASRCVLIEIGVFTRVGASIFEMLKAFIHPGKSQEPLSYEQF